MAKNEKENVDRIWEVVEKARVCMMATQFSDGLRVRPMEALPQRDENVICFITDRRGLREHQIEVSPETTLLQACRDAGSVRGLTGRAAAAAPGMVPPREATQAANCSRGTTSTAIGM